MKKIMSKSASPGGGSTINGVLYQLLWTLLRVSKIAILDFDAKSSESVSSAVVIAEPTDGGDVQIDGNHQEVEQLKARSNGTAWSLQDLVKKVLPDLFLAVSSDPNKLQTFRLVSEGGIGNWLSVYTDFFQDLRNRNFDAFLSELDNSKLLTTGARNPTVGQETFFPDPCTEMSLFQKICDVVGSKPKVGALNLVDIEIKRRVWKLLENFDFPDPIKHGEIQSRVDALLLSIVDKDRDIPCIRNHLAVELAKLATQGNAIIKSKSFLKLHGLDSLPLTDWVAHRKRAEKVLSKTLSRRGFNSKHSVRQPVIPAQTSGGILVVAGESGCGKSWTINSLALRAVSSSLLPVLVESCGDGEKDMEKVAKVFWQDIHDSDENLAFSRIDKRIGKVLGEKTSSGVAVFIDGVTSIDEADSLLNYSWEDGSSSLAFSCSPKIAYELEQRQPHRLNIVTVDHFTLPQLHDYLHRRIGDAWSTIPSGIRSTLLIPLVAALYCDLFGSEDFRLDSEYQLFRSVFKKKVAGEFTSTPLDEAVVDHLAIGVRDGDNYPWTKQQLFDAGFENDHVVRLVSNGWLVQTDDDSYRVFHDRLLNWSIASATERQLASRKISDDVFLDYLSKFYLSDPKNKIDFGYVPMDALWLLTNRQPEKSSLALHAIKKLEGLSDRRIEDLYEMIVTLGECITSALFERYKELNSFDWPAILIEKSLIATSHNGLEAYIRELAKGEPIMQRKAVRLANSFAFPSMASEFWQIHVAGQDNPIPFGEKENRKGILYRETFYALNQAAKTNHDWLNKQLSSSADKSRKQLNDLATIVSNVDDKGVLWRKHKEILVKELCDSNKLSLIRCIQKFRDSSAIRLLEEWAVCSDPISSSHAIRALASLDCNKAIARLKDTDPKMMRINRERFVCEIVERNRERANEAISVWMNEVDCPWEIGLLFLGRENDLTVEHLDCLLDSLTNQLSKRTEQGVNSNFHFEFGMLGRVSKLDLVDCLRRRSGTELEFRVRQYLLDLGPRKGLGATADGRSGAFMTLHLMGADSLTQVINRYLEDDDQYGLNETIKWAVKAPNEETFEKLFKLVHLDESWPGPSAGPPDTKIAIVQNSALQCLASHGKWEEVSKGVKHLGLGLFRGLERPENPIKESWVADLYKEVKQSPNVGNVKALGIFGSQNYGETILYVLQNSEPASDLASQCLCALRYCSYFSDDAVKEVAKHLRIKKHRHAAMDYLIEACNEAAWEVLVEDLETNFNHINAWSLINLSPYSKRVIEICHEQLTKNRVFAEYEMLEFLLTKTKEQEHQNQLLNNESLQAFIHFEASKSEGRFRHIGSKERMIRCLALTKQELAYSVCLKCIDNKDSKDRTRYTTLLREINSKKSTSDLALRLSGENSRLMRNSILRTLQGLDLSEQIEQLIGSECEDKRRAACELLGVCKISEKTNRQLSRMLADRSAKVVQAAAKGLHQHQK